MEGVVELLFRPFAVVDAPVLVWFPAGIATRDLAALFGLLARRGHAGAARGSGRSTTIYATGVR